VSPTEQWLVELDRGRPEAAWDAFLGRYRGLLFGAIRYYVHDHDDVMDVFTWVCERLREDDFRRLRRYAGDADHRARFSTWLVAVVRNLAVDWLRRRDGRLRPLAVEASLTCLQRRILEEVFTNGRSHAEAFELIRSRDDGALDFSGFLKELATVYRTVMGQRGRLERELTAPPPPDVVVADVDLVVGEEARSILAGAMQQLSARDRVAVQMYVVDEVPAADVARVLGLKDAKAVYNRVYRSLKVLREHLDAAGLGRSDL